MKITCNFCNKELTELGGLIFSPPDAYSHCKKRHICKPCYSKLPNAGLRTPDMPKQFPISACCNASVEKIGKERYQCQACRSECRLSEWNKDDLPSRQDKDGNPIWDKPKEPKDIEPLELSEFPEILHPIIIKVNKAIEVLNAREGK